jgi:acyl-CoA reductase-like NAD-dependent aldehyde dehydrogenase
LVWNFRTFFKIFQEVGLPDGVLNLVCGLGSKAGEALVRHPDVKVLSFTGSTVVGRHIAQVAAPMMKRLSLELGGKNPALVFADARLDQAIPTLIRAAFLNQGEICLCTSRIYIQEAIFDQFLEKFVKAAQNLKVGDPNDPEVFMGALNSKGHLEKVRKYAGIAKDEGGIIHCGEGTVTIDEKARRANEMPRLPSFKSRKTVNFIRLSCYNLLKPQI